MDNPNKNLYSTKELKMISGPACLVLSQPVSKRIVVKAADLGKYITVLPYQQSLEDCLLLSEPILLKGESKEVFPLDKCRPAKINRHDNLFIKIKDPDPRIERALAIACEFFYRAKRKAVLANSNEQMNYGKSLFFAIEPKQVEGLPRHFLNPIIVEERK